MTQAGSVAVVGAGISGAACASGLRSIGLDVTVFDKSKGLGGRMATRRERWIDAAGLAHEEAFDHGCGQFRVTRPRFRVVVERAIKLGFATHWRQDVYAPFPAPRYRHVVVPTPDMPALCRHLLTGVALRLEHAVTGLQRLPGGGWWLRVASDGAEAHVEGPFDHVVIALPPAQAAPLLSPHCADWARELSSVRATPCWTLMAASDDVDWPWDSALLENGELARIARNDRKPGRTAPHDVVPWVAQATPAWSIAHLNADPAEVIEVLSAALARKLSSVHPVGWHHRSVHRWRYARIGRVGNGRSRCLWDDALGLGVCGDAFGDGNVEAAWTSGDELADEMSASFDAAPAFPLSLEPQPESEPALDLPVDGQ
jgi:predicted NAD/FAD-dependent oxidoreductase